MLEIIMTGIPTNKKKYVKSEDWVSGMVALEDGGGEITGNVCNDCRIISIIICAFAP